jgi:hypothetical protein
MGTALLSFEYCSLDSRPARLLRFQGGLFKVHADCADTAGQFALLEVEGGPGGEPPLHVHQNEDELFYVFEGTLKNLSRLRGNRAATWPIGILAAPCAAHF